MNTEQVRCWRVGVNGELFITYTEGDMGHRLIGCKSCGEIYAVNAMKQLYIESDLDKHLSSVNCLKCGKLMSSNWAYYPESYLDKEGGMQTFERSQQIPDDSDSIVVEFPEVFS